MRGLLTDRTIILVRPISAVLKPLSRNLVEYRAEVIVSESHIVVIELAVP